MKTYAVETAGLTKRFRSIPAVDAIDLKIPQGEIFGLVGENDERKSTLMKLLAGMMQPSEGSFRLFGKEGKEDAFLYHRVGALIEQPGLIPSLTAMENMKTKALAMGLHDERELQRLLALCDIDKSGRKKVRAFSLGMKQRLGIALTLINDPDLLILDEPTNGIDPRGFEAIRSLLLRLNREEGKTIIISSHILEELSKIATSYGFMRKGRIIEQLSSQELEEKSQEYLLLRTPDAAGAAVLLEERFAVRSYRIVSASELQINERIDSAALIAALVKADIPVWECTLHHQSLEQYFFAKNGGERDVESAAQ